MKLSLNLFVALFALTVLTGFNTYPVKAKHKEKVNNILETTKKVVVDKRFKAILESMNSGDFNHKADAAELKTHGGKEILAQLLNKPVLGVVCRRAKSPFNFSTNAWEGGQTPQLRCSRLHKRKDELWVGTVFHEHGHGVGYSHKKQTGKLKQCTVPNVLGDLSTYIARLYSGDAKLSSSACQSLKMAVERNIKS